MSTITSLLRKISASSDAAAEAWNRNDKDRSDKIARPEILIGVYVPQMPSALQKGRIPSPEIYTTITDGRGDTIFYFAKDRQIYAVVAFKCDRKRTPDGRYYYEIVPSAEDLEMRRSPLRPIGCKVNEKDPISTFARLYVVDTIEPFVSKTYRS